MTISSTKGRRCVIDGQLRLITVSKICSLIALLYVTFASATYPSLESVLQAVEIHIFGSLFRVT